MTTTTHVWDPSWTTDTNITGTTTIANGANAVSAEHSNDGKIQSEISVKATFGGTYDQPPVIYVERKTFDSFGSRFNAHDSFPLEGGVSQTQSVTFTVGPDVNDFQIDIHNNSGADLTNVGVYIKQMVVDST